MKTKIAQAAAGRLLLKHPDGLTRAEATKKLGLAPRRWQSIIKHPMFMKHPESRKGRGTRWIVDRKVMEKEYDLSPDETNKTLTKKQRAGHLKNALNTKKSQKAAETPAERLQRFYEANKPKDLDSNIVDFFTGSPPYSPNKPRRVTLTIDGVNIDMDITGQVSFTIRG